MTPMEMGAYGKGVHQFPVINYNLGRLCLGHSCLHSLPARGNQEKEATCCVWPVK